jgi:hypothetical protein
VSRSNEGPKTFSNVFTREAAYITKTFPWFKKEKEGAAEEEEEGICCCCVFAVRDRLLIDKKYRAAVTIENITMMMNLFLVMEIGKVI